MRISLYPLPQPLERVWSNVCMDNKTEIYELCTQAQEEGRSGRPLWHKEYPLGQGIADFLYTDLEYLERMIHEAQPQMEACAAGDGDLDSHERVFFLCRYCLDQTPLLLPLVQCMEQIRLQQKGYDDVLMRLEEYKALQPKLSFIAHDFFETEKSEKTIEQFHERMHSDPQHYFPLEFGVIRYGDAWRTFNNTNLRFPYDPVPEVVLGDDNQIVQPEDPQSEIVYTDILNTESPQMLASFLIRGYLKSAMQYKSCKFCGRLFGVTSGHGSMYCSRRLEGSNKTCKEAGSLRLYEQRMMEDTALRAFKKSYKTHNARIRRGQMTREQFDTWAEEARTRRDQYVAGKLSEEDFIDWLNEDIRN